MRASSLHICALIPTYNNRGTVVDVVRRTHRYMQDIIVVADGCTDDTLTLLQALDFPVTVVSYARNRGKGYALKQGFRKALEMGFEYVLTIDADGQHYPEDIPLLVEEALLHPGHIIIGSRGLRQENMPRQNTFANRFSNFWFRIQTGRRLPDTQSGFRIYPLYRMHGWQLMTARYESELELLVFSTWARIATIPVAIRVYYPPREERVSHFRPAYDFTRISLLNSLLCVVALVYGLPRRYAPSLWYVGKLILICFLLITPYAWAVRLLGDRQPALRRHFRVFCSAMARYMSNSIPGVDFRVTGKQFRPQDHQPRLYIANHNSLLDILIMLAEQPNLVVLTQDWVGKNPLFAPVVKAARFPLVKGGIENSLEVLRDSVRRGDSILVFPEGTRSRTGHLLPMHSGAMYIAEQLNLPVVPVCIHHSYDVLNKVDFLLYTTGDITLEYLPEITTTDPTFGVGYRHRTKSIEHYYRHLLEINTHTATILGAGVGGLFTAALLAKEGYSVTVLEQLPVAGGGMYSYERDGEWWMTGIHVACGLGEGGTVRQVLDALGIQVPIEKCPPDVAHGVGDIYSLLYGGATCGRQADRERIIDLFNEGTYRFIGGTRPLVDALCLYITRHGGRILLGEKVTKVEIQDKHATCVYTEKHEYRADVVVSSLHPKMLLPLCTEPVFRPATIHRIEQTEESYGSFKVYIKFKPQSFRYLPENHFILPENIAFLTPPVAGQDEWAHTMEVIAPLEYSELAPWQQDRKADYAAYEAFKHSKAEALIDRIEAIYPNLREQTDSYFTSTSLTFREDYLTPEGAMFGLNQPLGMYRTRVDNLYLTGQNCLLHGLCGTVMTSQLVAEEICRRNS